VNETEPDDDNVVYGAKALKIIASPVYPIVSAYEFEFLKEEEVLQQRMDNCTIYIIVQRPLTYFDNVRLDDSYIYFDITDGTQEPFECRINLVVNEICAVGEAIDIDVLFFTKEPNREQPFRDVGAIKLFDKDGKFILWWSPQKILYEMLVKNLVVETIGDPLAYLDFRVLYVGKAFSQKVWQRLTGHEKMQRILTLEGPIGASPEARAPFEVSLILLKAMDFDEMVVVPDTALPRIENTKLVSHSIDLDQDGAIEAFSLPFIDVGDEALTRDLEAQLIRYFRPEYNEVFFENYPDIKGGLLSKGYSWSDFEIVGLPAALSTDHASTSVAYVVEH
jgi:hypothetical protein